MAAVTLRSGQKFPLLGMGTWHHAEKADEIIDAVVYAVENGLRHLDCAYIYKNEKEVGQALKIIFDKGIVKREDLFITSKLWNTKRHPDLVKGACLSTLKDLGLDYLDAYLIHWSTPFVNSDDNIPRNKFDGSVQYANIHFMDTWMAMEELVEEGLVKNIGMSNFSQKQMEVVLENAKIKPAILQVECNPRLSQEPLRKFSAENGVQFVAFSPFGSPDLPWGNKKLPHILLDSTLKAIGEKHQRSSAQVVLRWLFQRGIAAIPKSVIKEELLDNIKAQNEEFTLSPEEMEQINNLNQNIRKVMPIVKMPDGTTRFRDGGAGDCFFAFADEYPIEARSFREA